MATPFIDLHLHSNKSDGTYTPTEVVQKAAELKIKAIALADHDTLDGIPEAKAEAMRRGLEFIEGVEITTQCDGRELHLLGYYVNPTNDLLNTRLREYQKVRHQRIVEMVERLQASNIPLKPEAVFRLAGNASPGRPHLAQALVQAGFAHSMEEAFQRYLKRGKPGFAERFRVEVQEAIRMIHGAGGAAVIAHPASNNMDEAIPTLVRWGLDGIEVWHSNHSQSHIEHYSRIADTYKLLKTGGSDCHGMAKQCPLIGSVKVPYQVKVEMEQYLANKQPPKN